MEFLNFLDVNSRGIYVLIILIAVTILFIQWIASIFSIGKYSIKDKSESPTRQSIRYLMAEALAKIINDFRHLLALVIMFIFALALIVVFFKAGSNFENLLSGLQAVAAALGGLIGSIIGYYFGESAARPINQSPIPGNTSPDEIEQNTQNSFESIEPVMPPPVAPPQK